MNDTECGRIRDLLPLHLALREDARGPERPEAEEVERHLAVCAECRDESALVARLLMARPEPPASLLPSILAAARARPAGRITRWGLSRSLPWNLPGNLPWPMKAAAVVLLALGIGTVFRPDSVEEPTWALALETDAAVEWYGQEWMVAGEPQLDALTDDQLRALLEEMEP